MGITHRKLLDDSIKEFDGTPWKSRKIKLHNTSEGNYRRFSRRTTNKGHQEQPWPRESHLTRIPTKRVIIMYHDRHGHPNHLNAAQHLRLAQYWHIWSGNRANENIIWNAKNENNIRQLKVEWTGKTPQPSTEIHATILKQRIPKKLGWIPTNVLILMQHYRALIHRKHPILSNVWKRIKTTMYLTNRTPWDAWFG